MAPVDELVRVVVGPDGTLATGRSLPGRGAWLCAGSVSCVDLAARRRAFARALRADVPAAAVDRLRTTLVERGRLES